MVGDGVAPAPRPQGVAADTVGLHLVEGVQPVGVGGVAHQADAAGGHREFGGDGGQGIDAAAQVVLIGVELVEPLAHGLHADEHAELARVAGGVVQNQPVDLPVSIEGVVGDVVPGQVHPRQTAGEDLHCGAAGDVQDLRPVGEGHVSHLGAVLGYSAGQAGGAQAAQGDRAVGGKADPHRVARLQVVGGPLVLIGVAVGGQDGHHVGGVGAAVAVVVGAALGLGDHAAQLVLHGAGAGHGRHAAAAAQEEGHRVPHPIGPQVGQGQGGLGALDLIGAAQHLHRGGVGGGGLQGLDDPHHLVRGHPQGAHGLVPVDHVVLLDGPQVGGRPVPVHRHPLQGEGDGAAPVAGGHQGPLHLPVDEAHQIQFPGGVEGVAQLAHIDAPLLGVCGHQVIEEVHGVLTGEGVRRPLGGHPLVQPLAPVQGQLWGGVGPGVVLRCIAQQPQGDGGPLRQGDGIVRAEGAVGIGGHQPGSHGGLHIASRPVGVGHVRVGGGGGLPHLVPVGGCLQGHGNKLRPGHVPGQLQAAAGIAVQDAQGGDHLGHLPGGGNGSRRKAGQGQGEGETAGQQAGQYASFHQFAAPFYVDVGAAMSRPN